MDIEVRSFTTTEISPDGKTIFLGFLDQDGAPTKLRLNLQQVGALAMTLPDLVNQALQSRYKDPSLRYAYPLTSFSVEPSSSPETTMMTLSTTEGFSVCFALERKWQQKIVHALSVETKSGERATMN